jgi:hypothetical protein
MTAVLPLLEVMHGLAVIVPVQQAATAPGWQ